MLEWLDEQLVSALEDQLALLAIDRFSGYKMEEELDTFRAHDITPSIIQGGCTGLVQPLDVSINRPFKDILKVSQITSSSSREGVTYRGLYNRRRWRSGLEN